MGRARADEGAVRNTRDVDLLIRRADLGSVRTALKCAGFVYHHRLDVETFIDGPEGRPSEAVHILFAGEKVKPENEFASPELDESERAAEFQVTTLPALVRMKLIVSPQGPSSLAGPDRRRAHRRYLARSFSEAAG